jgi:flagellar secretion chaperone FliS
MSMDARSTYREESVQGATPVGQVVLLYEQAIEDVRRAVAEMETGRIEQRTQAINHALLVIGYLQSSLNLERGGAVAKQLARFYEMVRAGLCAAQAEQSAKLLREHMTYLMQVRASWVEAEKKLAGRTEPEMRTDTPGERKLSSGWKA